MTFSLWQVVLIIFIITLFNKVTYTFKKVNEVEWDSKIAKAITIIVAIIVATSINTIVLSGMVISIKYLLG